MRYVVRPLPKSGEKMSSDDELEIRKAELAHSQQLVRQTLEQPSDPEREVIIIGDGGKTRMQREADRQAAIEAQQQSLLSLGILNGELARRG
jgi:hypothetical protein